MAFQKTDAANLSELAAFATYDLSALVLPPQWRLIGTFHSLALRGGAQGFVAAGALSSTGVVNAVVVIGLAWPDFIELSNLSFHQLAPPPPGLLPAAALSTASCELGYTLLYGGIREELWRLILFARQTVPEFQTAMPLVIAAHGPAGPLGQFAALDLLPGHPNNGQTSPASALAGYVFSCPAVGNAGFADYFRQAVPEAYTVNLATSLGATIDFFPAVPAGGQGYAVAGVVVGGEGGIPSPDDPWVERSPENYQATLAGSAPSALEAPAPAPARNPFAAGFAEARRLLMPAPLEAPEFPGFDPVLAYLLSRLCEVPAGRMQHGNLTRPIPQFAVQSDVSVNGIIWASVLVSNDSVVVAFRGPITWEETLSAWGSVSMVTPAWLSVPGEVLEPYAQLYAALRPALWERIREAQHATRRFYLTGHCLGGALASLAALDFQLNPPPQIAPLAGLYTFGAPPIGSIAFAQSFAARVPELSFHVARPNDVIPRLVLGSHATVTLGAAISLPGGLLLPQNSSTFHALATYSALLNPEHGMPAPFAGEAVAALGERAEPREGGYAAALAESPVPWSDVHKCPIESAKSGGRLTFSTDAAASYVPATHTDALGRSHLAVQDIIVSPGHHLNLDAPHPGGLRLLARSVVLGPGARVFTRGNVEMEVGELIALPPVPDHPMTEAARINVRPASGSAGMPGVAGAHGMAGAPRHSGGAGGGGGTGTTGSAGQNAVPISLTTDEVSGTIEVDASGGAGGPGGAGGAGGEGGQGGLVPGGSAPGGIGGPGGTGGAGGPGGNGSTIRIFYRRQLPDTKWNVNEGPSPGGKGGAGGRGGAGGAGHPRGARGGDGAHGPDGPPGQPGKVEIRQIA